MGLGKTPKEQVAEELANAVRAYNACTSPSLWRGDNQIDALYRALRCDEDVDAALGQLVREALLIPDERDSQAHSFADDDSVAPSTPAASVHEVLRRVQPFL